MLYVDNAATTRPKPPGVVWAVQQAVQQGANPGRSGHAASLAAAENVYQARRAAASFFDMTDETNVVFTPGCTYSLNVALKGTLRSGDHVVVSSLEHNAVMRPLQSLQEQGITYTRASVFPGDDDRTVDAFRKSINGKTKMIVAMHASNVWGIRLPIERLCALAHAYGLLFVTDAAQSAGVLPLSMKDGYDMVCVPGHKGLYGPMGTGLLLLSGSVWPRPLIEGGTGSASMSLEQPEESPDRYESGTPNYSGIMGLKAGIDFVASRGQEKILSAEMNWIRQLYKGLETIPGVRLLTPFPTEEYFVPVLSFVVEGMESEEAAEKLHQRGIAVRAGLHCAPCAHEAMGTLETGTIRVAPSVFTPRRGVSQVLEEVQRICRKK